MFEKGMMRSSACEAQVFKAGQYTTTLSDGATMVKGALKNDKGDESVIEATIKGDMLTGTATAKKADGTTSDTLKISAMLQKKTMKIEPPMKMEYPASEHPK